MKFFFSLILLLTTLTGTPAFDPIDDCTYTDWTHRSCGIKEAVDEYLDNAKKQATVDKYGPIEDWNTSLVTDMSSLFDGDKIVGSETHVSRQQFNENISKWKTGKVTTMNSSKL